MDINIQWTQLVSKLLNAPSSSPRNQETKELLGVQSRVDMSNPVLTIEARNLGYRFMHAEAAWILSGDNRVDTITEYSREISRFSDDGMFYYGAYGPKVKDQIQYVVKTLRNDQDSRQAVINIWREHPPNTKDVPCTLSLQFLIRDHIMACIATMRSSDIWLGWPYDCFNFTMITRYIIRCLQIIDMPNSRFEGLEPGTLILNAGSQHLYHRNLEAARRCTTARDRRGMDTVVDWYKLSPDQLIERLRNNARK